MKNTTNTSRQTKKTTTAAPVATGLTRAEVEDIVDRMLRSAFREHGRNIEKHLKSIHERLVAIETHGALR